MRKEIKDMNKEEVAEIQIQIVRYYADISRGHSLPDSYVKWVKSKINEPLKNYFKFDKLTGELREQDLETGKFVISATIPRQADNE